MEEKIRKNLSFILRCYRLSIDLTQKRLAQQMNVSQGYLAKIEARKLMPSLYNWVLFCEKARIPLNMIQWEEETIRDYFKKKVE